MHGGHSTANWEVIYWHWDYLTHLKGMLIHNLEKGVRLIIKRDRPMKKFAVAKSNPPSLQLLISAVDKTSQGTM